MTVTPPTPPPDCWQRIRSSTRSWPPLHALLLLAVPGLLLLLLLASCCMAACSWQLCLCCQLVEGAGLLETLKDACCLSHAGVGALGPGCCADLGCD